jgi:hypothetical protein
MVDGKTNGRAKISGRAPFARFRPWRYCIRFVSDEGGNCIDQGAPNATPPPSWHNVHRDREGWRFGNGRPTNRGRPDQLFVGIDRDQRFRRVNGGKTLGQ